MNKHLMPDEVEPWDWKTVSAATARAVRVMDAISTRYGPASYRSYWPEIRDEESVPSDEEPRFLPNRLDINRAEIVLLGYQDPDGGKHAGWLQGSLIAYPELRQTFAKWAKWAAYGKRSFDGLPETEDDFAFRLGMSESSLRRACERAGAIIAVNLNGAGLPVRYVEKPRRKNRARAQSATAR